MTATGPIQGPDALQLPWSSPWLANKQPMAMIEGPSSSSSASFYPMSGQRSSHGAVTGRASTSTQQQTPDSITSKFRQDLLLIASRNPSLQKLVDNYEAWERNYR